MTQDHPRPLLRRGSICGLAAHGAAVGLGPGSRSKGEVGCTKVILNSRTSTVTIEPMTTSGVFRMVDAPMERDRTEGFRFVRDAGDVFQTADGVWLLTSAEAVQFAHRHPDIFASGPAYGSTSATPVPSVPVGIDPPAHIKYRKILDPMLAPRVINAMEENLRAQVRDLVLAFADRGTCDVVREIARPYPTQVFLTLFGLPLADRDRLTEWVETQTEGTSGIGEQSPSVVKAETELLDYLQRCIDDKRKQPGDDILSRVLSLEGEDVWSNEEVLGLAKIFTLAGLDTVTGAIGFMMLHLARSPELRRRVVADSALVGPLIEEVLRLEPPAPMIPRFTTQDIELCGVHIPAGSPTLLILGTANRDEARFEHPDRLDVDQAAQGHVTFGGGIHRCLGSHLARREMRLVVEEFHKLIPEYQIAPGFEPEAVWPSFTLHLPSLPLVFPVRGGAA